MLHGVPGAVQVFLVREAVIQGQISQWNGPTSMVKDYLLTLLLNKGQGRVDGRRPAGGCSAHLPTRPDGARGRPDTEGIGTALLNIHRGPQRDLQPPADGAGHAVRNQPALQVPRSRLDTQQVSRTSSSQRDRGCTVPSAATARRAKGKGRANPRAGVRADRPPLCSRPVKWTRPGNTVTWTKGGTCGLPQGAKAGIWHSHRTEHLFFQ